MKKTVFVFISMVVPYVQGMIKSEEAKQMVDKLRVYQYLDVLKAGDKILVEEIKKFQMLYQNYELIEHAWQRVAGQSTYANTAYLQVRNRRQNIQAIRDCVTLFRFEILIQKDRLEKSLQK